MKTKAKLLATSPTIEGITGMVNEFFYSTSYRLESFGEGKDWMVIGNAGRLQQYRVTQRGARYRFEAV